MQLKIELPWPDKKLSPNGRCHWRGKASAVSKHRDWARTAATAAMRAQGWQAVEKAELRIRFVDPSKRRRDRDNHQAMCKSYLDGFADAGVIVDDSGFITHPATFEVGPVRGVVFEIVASKEAGEQ